MTDIDYLSELSSTTEGKYSRLSKLYSQAEKDISEISYKLSSNKSKGPATEKLRQAGHHLICSLVLSEQSPENEENHLWEAEKRCKEAASLTYIFGIIDRFEAFMQFEKDYPNFLITEVIKEYLDDRFIIFSLKKIPDNVRENKLDIILNTFETSQLKQHYEDAIKIVDKYNNARIEINKAIRIRQKEQRNTLVAFIASIATIIALFFSGYNLFLQHRDNKNTKSTVEHSQSTNPKNGVTPKITPSEQ